MTSIPIYFVIRVSQKDLPACLVEKLTTKKELMDSNNVCCLDISENILENAANPITDNLFLLKNTINPPEEWLDIWNKKHTCSDDMMSDNVSKEKKDKFTNAINYYFLIQSLNSLIATNQLPPGVHDSVKLIDTSGNVKAPVDEDYNSCLTASAGIGPDADADAGLDADTGLDADAGPDADAQPKTTKAQEQYNKLQKQIKEDRAIAERLQKELNEAIVRNVSEPTPTER